MADISISISINADAAHALLSRAPNDINIAMRGGMEDATTLILAIAKRYPPQRAGSTYRRTHTLEKSWSRRIEGSGLTMRGIVGSNGNIAPYNRIVMSRRDQVRVHRGRWSTIEDIVERNEATVQRMFRDRLRAAGY